MEQDNGRAHRWFLLRRSLLDGKTDSPRVGALLPGVASDHVGRASDRRVPRSLLRRDLVAQGALRSRHCSCATTWGTRMREVVTAVLDVREVDTEGAGAPI